MKLCNRQTFILLTKGIFLERGADAVVRLGCTREAYEAMEAHNRGDRIGLTRNGVIVSYMKDRIETVAAQSRQNEALEG